MRLEIEKTKVRKLCFGSQTGWIDGELTIYRKELTQLLEKDNRLKKVDLAIALPGEKSRILQVVDVLEPRFKSKIEGSGNYVSRLGTGHTRALEGMAVVISDYSDRRPGMSYGAIIEMSGPSVDVSPFSRTCNLVLLATPRDGLSAGEYQIAIKQAGLKAGAYLAESVCRLPPEETALYDLPPLTGISRELKHLPKVVYIPQIFSQQFVPIPGEPILFGRQAEGIVPTLVHPNQILDGAVTSAYPGLNLNTYDLQNSSIIESLYQWHGHDLCFCGVIVTVAPNNVADFDLMADLAASMAKHLVNADGAILTKCGGGAPELAMARTAQRCEQLGIKTVVAMLNMGADVKDYKYGATTIFNIPEVDAIVSMGTPYPELILPPVEKVIGKPNNNPEAQNVNGEMSTHLGMIKGAMCQLGSSKLSAVRY